ncbi:hypothetical protein KKF34_10360 [Myxococcota bacterium]|nr:hypothetical protein [Myxococcota bacterium]MBU1380496.1 hypothetical protein [Myxococcota bacterium]MBU1497268.1 hypothetical protein [Myxococcota bacterium]
MRCPGCGIELNHTALKRKKCLTCGFILPVISAQKSETSEAPVVSSGGLKLPPPKRKPVSIGAESAMDDDYREGVVHTTQVPDEPFISEEPSITTEEPDFPLPPRPTSSESITFSRKPRRVREESEKTIKVEMLPPPVPPSATSDIWKDRALIFFIIISTLSITILLYLFLK